MIRQEYLKGFMFFCIGLHILNSPAAYARLWKLMLALMAFMAIMALIFYYGPCWSKLNAWYEFNPACRARSLAQGYGSFASYLSIVFPYLLAFPLALKLDKGWKRILWAALVLLLLLACFLTFTRILWLCLPLSALLFFWMIRPRRLKAIFLCGAVLALAALMIVSNKYSHGEEWGQLLDSPHTMGGTGGDLIKVWNFALDKIQKNPLRGTGFGRLSFWRAYPDFVNQNNPALRHTHNIFVDYAIQMGLQGPLVLLALLLVLLKALWSRPPPARGDAMGAFRLATGIMVCSFMLRNQVDDFFVDDPALLFWLLCGLALGSKVIDKPATKESE
jgi:O-antigen ligase